ncbi:MAG: T9SS type A sorting domain-containing protein [Chitinophagaceae bacterium]
MKQFNKIIWLWCLGLLAVMQGVAQPAINRVEYYVDTDPGYGNGIAIGSPAGNDYSSSFTIILAPLATGVHIVGVRSRDANGAWSIDNKWIFVKPQSGGVAASVPIIARVEYYIDTDPGYGNGIEVGSPGMTDVSTSFNIDLVPLNAGVHIVGVRSKDANGAWSLDNKYLFIKPFGNGGPTSVPNINRVEYYVDTDPGYGNGTGISIGGPGQDLPNLSFTLDMTPMFQGVHIVGVRSRDDNGAWSLDNKYLFIKPYSTANLAPRIVSAMEYYMDTDPGYGKATPVAINPAGQIANFNVYANITGITSGKHKLFFRSKDDQQAWSLNYVDSFTIAAPAASPAINVNSINTKTLCARDSIKIAFDATGTFNAGNQFNVELSDALGNFPVTPVVIGTVISVTDSIVMCRLPSHVFPDGNTFKVRVVSTNPAVTGIGSEETVTIHDRPYAQTITGRNEVNGTYTWPYNVPAAAGSNWNWMVNGGTLVATTITNNGSILWAQPASPVVAGNIRIIETNQFGCLGDTSNLNLNIYKLRIDNTPATITPCKGNGITVNFTADGAFDAGNMYTAELSDSLGSFASPVTIGTATANGNGINQVGNITATIPANVNNGTAYRIRVLSSIPVYTGAFNGSPISIIRPRTSAITGAVNVNKGYDYTYNVTGYALSTYAWAATGGTQTTGTNTNTAGINFNTNGAQTVSVTESTQFGCPGDLIAKSVNVYTLAITNTPANLNPCKGSIINVDYSADGVYSGGNSFTAQLSDATGSFTSPVNIGSTNAAPVGNGNTGTFSCTIPANTPNGTGYRIRIIASTPLGAPAFTGTQNTSPISIITPVTSAITGTTTVNAGKAYPYNVVTTAGSTYAWVFSNGTQNSGTNTNAVTGTFNSNGTQTVTVTETNQYGCLAVPVILTVNVLTLAASTTTITGFPVCPGQVVTVGYSVNGVYDAGNTIKVQLSDATGSFATPVDIGTVNLSGILNNQTGSINGTIPLGQAAGTGYRVRLVSSAPIVTGNDNGTNLTVNALSNVFTLTQNMVVNASVNLAAPDQNVFPCFSGGKIVLGNFNLTVNGNISNYDLDHFVVSNGTGTLKLVNASANNWYPVGSSLTSRNFININNTGTPDNFKVRVIEEVRKDGTSGNLITSNNVNRTWLIDEDALGGSNASLTLAWNQADELPAFDRTACVMAHYETSQWNFGNFAAANAGTGPLNGMFTTTQSGYTSFSPFTVTGAVNSPLPIQLLSFHAVTEKDKVQLTWATSTEINSRHFVVQRSQDGNLFDNVATVAAAGNSATISNYTLADADAIQYKGRVLYYRLQLLDINGDSKYSQVLTVKIPNGLNNLRLLVNPVNTDALLQYQSIVKEKLMLKLVDALGKTILYTQKDADAGSNQFKLNTSTLAAGVYFIELSNGKEKMVVRMVKE